jgi:hypothetical protein
MKQPPLPSEVLHRLLRVARFDGASVLGLAGAFALVSAAAHDVVGAAIGLAVAAAGAIELHGVSLLRGGRPAGLRWLVSSQLYLMSVMLGYVAFRLSHLDISELRWTVTPEMAEQVRQLNMTVDQFLFLTMRCTFAAVGAVTILYQSGMIVYYLRRRAAVEVAVQELDLG